MSILEKIQQEINVPKNQYNNFGGYAYRSAEDIMIALKPILNKCNATLHFDDSIEGFGDRVFYNATAVLKDKDGKTIAQSSSYAECATQQKGMSLAQITGSSCSYARKYALAGMFLLDDTKDDDATNTHGKKPTTSTNKDNDSIPLWRQK